MRKLDHGRFVGLSTKRDFFTICGERRLRRNKP